MELRLGVVVPATGAYADVVVRTPVGTTLAMVADQLLGTVLLDSATGTFSVGGVAVGGTTLLGHPPLVEGALLQVGVPPGLPTLPGLPQLRVIGGPDAGGVHLLAPSSVLVGRRGSVRLDDPDVSREHCRLALTPDGATVDDLGSTNGSWIDGMRVDGTGVLPYDGVLRVGSTTLQLVVASEPVAPVVATGDGRLAFNRPPRLLAARSRVHVVVPAPPEERSRGPIPFVAAVVPLLLGVLMWRVLGNATFLLFTLLSPLMVIGNVVTERHAGRRQTRKQRALWQSQRGVAERILADAVRADERDRAAAALLGRRRDDDLHR